MTDVPGPGHVRDVQQPVDPRLELDDRAEIGEVPHPPGHPRAGPVTLLDRRPGIGLHLLHTERDPLGGAVDVEHDHFDLVADVDELGGVADATGPGHLGDVDEALYARLELDERAVVGEAHDLAPRLGARRIRLLDALPALQAPLLVAELQAARSAVT